MYPKISIVTPSYNQGFFLETTIKSILKQDYPDFEYIIMDGGSTDESKDIINNYSSKLSYWVSEKDRGQADAIHRGFSYATGELICWVNSDDILLPGALKHIALCFKNNPNVDLVSGGSILIDSRSKLMKNFLGFPSIYGDKGTMSYDRIVGRGFRFLQPGTMWRREAYYEVGGLDTEMEFSFDRDLFIRLTQRKSGVGTGRLVAGYRIHENSKTSLLQKVHAKEAVLLADRYKNSQRNIVTSLIRDNYYKIGNKWNILRGNVDFILNKHELALSELVK